MSRANNPQLKTWVEVKPESDFPIQNLPFGIFKTTDGTPRAGVAIGEFILDLSVVADAGLFNAITFDVGCIIAESAVIGRLIGFAESFKSIMTT